MPGSLAARGSRTFHGTQTNGRPGAPAKAAHSAQVGLITSQVFAVVVISVSLVMFAFGENLLGHFLSGT